MIESGKRYRIRGNSDYFREKYGTPNPNIEIKVDDGNDDWLLDTGFNYFEQLQLYRNWKQRVGGRGKGQVR